MTNAFSRLDANWSAPENIVAYTTLRQGPGASLAPYDHFNIAMHCGDNPDAVLKNRQHLQATLPNEPTWLNQTHGDRIIALPTHEATPEADASYTTTAKEVCVVMTADCLPVLLCNQAGSFVAAIHCGWRGLANHLIEKTIRKSQQAPDQLMAWLGPAIGPKHFSIHQDTYDALSAAVSHDSTPFSDCGEGQWFANLYTIAKIQLQKLGIYAIFSSDLCTYTHSSEFYSYRRENTTGRMASIIYMRH